MDQYLLLSLLSLLYLLLQSNPCTAGIQYSGSITPGLKGNYGNWIDKNGFFLVSNSSRFGFGFTSIDNHNFYLSIFHIPTNTPVWTANPTSPVTSTSLFVFTPSGNAYLESPDKRHAWTADTHGATSMALLDNGNLVLLRQTNAPSSVTLWQSFVHPTNTLLPGQNLTTGVALTTAPNNRNVTFSLRIQSGDLELSAAIQRGPPQKYWSLWSDPELRNNITSTNRNVHVAVISGNNTWNFYDREGELLTQVVVARAGGYRAVVLTDDGHVSFLDLSEDSSSPDGITIPSDPCGTLTSCDPYNLCRSSDSEVNCGCPGSLTTTDICTSAAAVPPCGHPHALREVRGVGYVALNHAHPTLTNTTLAGCRTACSQNCSCLVAFFDDGKSPTNCFLFDRIGSFTKASANSSVTGYVKVPKRTVGDGWRAHIVVILMAITVAALAGVVLLVVLLYRRRNNKWSKVRKKTSGDLHDYEISDDDGEGDFLESMNGKPVKYTYRELEEATGGFGKKLGRGGFGSVYVGELADKTRVAVKKLEGAGQGRKEFRAEVSIIGSVRHLHLVRLRGFCAEGQHRLLAYEYMPNGSLDRWIFQKGVEVQLLSWATRYTVALSTAKGLAYLHEGCDDKIVHCDIKPENVLLDEGFVAKVSDFGLAKLMGREESNVFTTLRGTRGYLAPEWIVSSAISERSDVYSYGMMLLEILAGRKGLEEGKEHLPEYAYRMVREGREAEVLDRRVRGGGDRRVVTAVRVALWCLQKDPAERPSMGRVVQMLEGVVQVEVPPPPVYPPQAINMKLIEMTSSSSGLGMSGCTSGDLFSGTRLSGPR